MLVSKAQGKRIAEGEITNNFIPLLTLVTQGDPQFCFGFITRFVTYQTDSPGGSVAAKECSLRALDHLNSAYVEEGAGSENITPT